MTTETGIRHQTDLLIPIAHRTHGLEGSPLASPDEVGQIVNAGPVIDPKKGETVDSPILWNR